MSETRPIVIFTTDNGTGNFTWPDGGQTPFYAGKGTTHEGGFRAPALLRWPGHVPAGSTGNGYSTSKPKTRSARGMTVGRNKPSLSF